MKGHAVPRPKLYDKKIKTALTETLRDLQRFASRDNATVSDLVRAAIGTTSATDARRRGNHGKARHRGHDTARSM
jgi:hypothetical protein